MATPRAHLRRAPIAEAILNFRVQPRPGIVFADLQSLAEQFRGEYPEAMQLVQAQVMVGPGLMQRAESAHGWLLRNEERGLVAQFRLDGLTLNKLPQYTRWEEIFGEAQRLWGAYVGVARPVAATQLSVRYVNLLEVPEGGLTGLLTIPPQIPPNVAGKLEGFLSRTIVHDAARGAKATVTQAMAGSAAPGQIKVVLDIDVVHIGEEDPDADFAAIFESLRELKNTIFFASVTDEGIAGYL